MSRFLVKRNPRLGLAAHIPDAQGNPLCRTLLKRDTWVIQDREPQQLLVCANCRKKDARSLPGKTTGESTLPSAFD
jgi:hypothetical protein